LLAREAGAQQFFAQEQLHNSFQQTATQAAVSRGSFVSAAFAPDTTAVDVRSLCCPASCDLVSSPRSLFWI
jgi:hypothetical protein